MIKLHTSKKIDRLLNELDLNDPVYANIAGVSYFKLRIDRFSVSKWCSCDGENSYTIMVDGTEIYRDGRFCFDGANKLKPIIIESLSKKIKKQQEEKKICMEEKKHKQDLIVNSFFK